MKRIETSFLIFFGFLENILKKGSNLGYYNCQDFVKKTAKFGVMCFS